VVSITPRPQFTPIVQKAGWAPGPVWTGAENLVHTGIRSPDPTHTVVFQNNETNREGTMGFKSYMVLVLFCVYKKLLYKSIIVMVSEFIIMKKRLNKEAVDKGLKITLTQLYDFYSYY
jgi:hypothetical protein